MGPILFILTKDTFFTPENLKENAKKILSRKVGFKIYVETKLAEELNLKCKQNCVRKLGLFDYNIVPTYMIWTYIYVLVLTGVYCMVYNILLFFFYIERSLIRNPTGVRDASR